MSKNFDKILQYPHKALRAQSAQIKKIDSEIISLFKDLKKLAKANSKDGITMVGLSAPQLGANLNAFIIYDFKKGKYIEIINPKTIYTSKETSNEWEGCASVGVGAKSLFAPVRRSKKVQFSYLNLDGEEELMNLSYYMSHIYLHEIDHLNGIIFLDRVEDPKMILTAKELDLYAEKNNGKYPKI
jgi:peptide deformylase